MKAASLGMKNERADQTDTPFSGVPLFDRAWPSGPYSERWDAIHRGELGIAPKPMSS